MALTDPNGTASQRVSVEVLEPTLQFARGVGLPRLEADAMRVQGIIALRQGELRLAEQLALQTLGMTSALGMRLRVTASMVLLGEVLAAKGSRDATKVLDSAFELAQVQGYQMQMENVQRIRSQLAGSL